MRLRVSIACLLIAAACCAQTPQLIPFELRNGLIYLREGVNGSPPLNFILDTGASHTVLSLEKARSFGMALVQVESVKGGVGSASPPAYLVTDAVSFSMMELVYESNSVVAVPLEQLTACFAHMGGGVATPADGILGRDFFRRFLVEIDYPARLLRLHSPETFVYQSGGAILPLEVAPNLMFVTAQLKARGHPAAAAKLVLDTGADIELSLTTQFARAHGLMPAAGKMIGSAECGIAGPQTRRTRLGRLEALHLGKERIAEPRTVFYEGTRDRQYDGLLGGPALEGFNVIIDSSRNRLILERPARSP